MIFRRCKTGTFSAVTSLNNFVEKKYQGFYYSHPDIIWKMDPPLLSFLSNPRLWMGISNLIQEWHLCFSFLSNHRLWVGIQSNSLISRHLFSSRNLFSSIERYLHFSFLSNHRLWLGIQCIQPNSSISSLILRNFFSSMEQHFWVDSSILSMEQYLQVDSSISSKQFVLFNRMLSLSR